MKLTFALITFSLLALSGCESKNSNPKDYWQLNEPVVYAWDTSANASAIGFKKAVSKFKATDLKENLDYSSYIEFENLDPSIKFNIITNCTQSENIENDNESDKSTISSKSFSKISNLENTNQIYFYNQIPDEVLFDDTYRNSAPNYNCDFNVIATNSIGSEHSFTVKQLPINTFNKNTLDVESNLNNGKKNIYSINNSKIDFPSIKYNLDSQYAYTYKSLTDEELSGPAIIKCLNNKKFDISFENPVLKQNLDQIFKIKEAYENNISFYKKCRILTTVTQPNTETNEAHLNSMRAVWSEYFNVIFDSPKITIKTAEINNPNEYYPYNDGEYLDKPFHVFDLVFTNESEREVQIHLSNDNFTAKLNPMAAFGQSPLYKKPKDPGLALYTTLLPVEIGEEFETNLQFESNGKKISAFKIKPKESKTINLVFTKNFNCNFDKSNNYDSHEFSEVGMRLQSIDTNSIQDAITIDYQNQGKLESFPERFSFNQMLNKSGTNHLQTNLNGQYAIDTYILRNFLSNIPGAENYTDYKLDRIQSFQKSNPMFNQFQEQKLNLDVDKLFPKADFTKSFCQQVF